MAIALHTLPQPRRAIVLHLRRDQRLGAVCRSRQTPPPQDHDHLLHRPAFHRHRRHHALPYRAVTANLTVETGAGNSKQRC